MVNFNGNKYGFLVDSVQGRQESVIKPLNQHLSDIPHLAGATLTGDGDVAQLLDIGKKNL